MSALLALFAGVLLAQAGPLGPNKVHYKVDDVMASSGVDADATGRVRSFVKKQGNSNHQRLRVTAKNLEPRTPYALLAQTGDSNDFHTVTTFITSREGVGKVTYFQNRALRDHGHQGHGAGVNKHALPAVIEPLTDVRTLTIVDSHNAVVLSLDLHASPAMEFELASVLQNTGSDPMAIGCVAVAYQGGNVQFRLFASGQSSEYTLCVNGSVVATYETDGTGRLAVGAYPDVAPSPLLVKKLDLRDVRQEVVLESDVR